MKPALRGVYAITDGRHDKALRAAASAVLRGGVRWLQYRDKSGDAAHRLAEARMLLELCQQHGAGFIINDDVALAAQLGAGVHLGRADTDIKAARLQLGPAAVIGLSCYNRMPAAADAAAASYLAFGAMFPSSTKPHALHAQLTLLAEARRSHPGKALCAIGGINPDNAGSVVQAGADLIAVVAGLFGASDTAAMTRRARLLAGLYQEQTRP